jgi:OFA family oxalate/formate antiporter-like MFS transporter
MDNFGPANQGVNYGIVFIGFSSAAFVAPKVTASLAAANNGNFTKAFYVVIAVVLLGLGFSLVYAKRKTAVMGTATETIQ